MIVTRTVSSSTTTSSSSSSFLQQQQTSGLTSEEIHPSVAPQLSTTAIGSSPHKSHFHPTTSCVPPRVVEFSQWTCILRLADVLEFLYASLGSGGDANSTVWATAPPMPDVRGFLPPNRFDMGYYKGNTNAMDLKE